MPKAFCRCQVTGLTTDWQNPEDGILPYLSYPSHCQDRRATGAQGRSNLKTRDYATEHPSHSHMC